MTVRVLVTESEFRKAEESFSSASGMECLCAPDAELKLAEAIRDARARHVVIGAGRYAGALYEALHRGGVIARYGVGHDGVDKVKATAAGLLCTNTPEVLDQSVAEHTMLLVAAAARRLPQLSAGMARGVWEPAAGQELQGKTLAIIGCGRIGRRVARIASLGFGMTVVGCSKPGVEPPAGLEHFRFVSNDFSAAVRHAQFVSLHLSARPENARFINASRLAEFSDGAWLINTARGSVVDEAALGAALTHGRLAGAALDVFDREPYAPADGSADLRSFPNVILTPHVGSNTAEANRRIATRALLNISYAEAGDFARMDLLNPDVLIRRSS